MEIRIGIHHTGRELNVDTDRNVDDLTSAWSAALDGSGVFIIESTKGDQLVVNARSIDYIDAKAEQPRKVGFGLV